MGNDTAASVRGTDEVDVDAIVDVRGLVKSFGSYRALKGIDLRVPRGHVLGLLGPNGAGKTTTVRVLTTLLRPDGGSVRVAGYDVVSNPSRVRASIGLSGQYAAVDEKLTGLENLVMVGRLYGMRRRQARRRAEELLEWFRLAEAGSRPSGTYSGGMRRRLDLAGALIAAPPVVVLDEPTTGLDPRGRIDTWQVVAELVAEGTTVLLTTQYLEEADRLADSIVVIDAGTVICRGSADELKAQTGGSRVDVVVEQAEDLSRAVGVVESSTTGPVDVAHASRTLSVPAPDGQSTLHRVLAALHGGSVPIVEAALRRPTLDDVFLRLTGHPAAEEEDVA